MGTIRSILYWINPDSQLPSQRKKSTELVYHKTIKITVTDDNYLKSNSQGHIFQGSGSEVHSPLNSYLYTLDIGL